MTRYLPLAGYVEASADLLRGVRAHQTRPATFWHRLATCPGCAERSLMVEAAALAYDAAVARVFSGRRPRIWSKEVPA